MQCSTLVGSLWQCLHTPRSIYQMAHLEREANNGVLRRLPRATALQQNLKMEFCSQTFGSRSDIKSFSRSSSSLAKIIIQFHQKVAHVAFCSLLAVWKRHRIYCLVSHVHEETVTRAVQVEQVFTIELRYCPLWHHKGPNPSVRNAQEVKFVIVVT